MKRREFLAAAGCVAAATVLKPAFSATRKPLGIEMFSLPRMAEKDLPGTLSMLAGMGYTQVQFYGPFDFGAAETLAYWKSIEPVLGFKGRGFFGRSPQEIRKLLDANGLTAPSVHVDLATIEQKTGQLAEAAHAIGSKYAIVPAIPAEQRRTLDDYKRMADTFNRAGKLCNSHGLTFGYHNHGYGWHEMQGRIPERVLFDSTDPKLVTLEMDIFWTAAAGVDPVQLLKDYPTRYKQLHLKDMKEHRTFSGDGGDNDQWMELDPLMTSAGDGVLDLKAIVAEGRKLGIEEFIVEQDVVKDPEVALRRSADYVSKLLA